LGLLIFKFETRWQTLKETIPIAFDTEANKAWLDPSKYPYPKLSNGEQIHVSNYLRFAWIKLGLTVAKENPWGTGFGRSAFGHQLARKYNNAELLGWHSHSGLLDVMIGTGFIGGALWCLLLLSIIYSSLKNFIRHTAYFALMLFFLTMSYSARMVIDSIVRDHMIQQYLFLVGLLSVLMIKEKQESY
jgi:O-antigen ligase